MVCVASGVVGGNSGETGFCFKGETLERDCGEVCMVCVDSMILCLANRVKAKRNESKLLHTLEVHLFSSCAKRMIDTVQAKDMKRTWIEKEQTGYGQQRREQSIVCGAVASMQVVRRERYGKQRRNVREIANLIPAILCSGILVEPA